MAQPQTIFDEVDEAVEDAATNRANARIDAGEGIPQAIMGEWLQALGRGEPALPTFLKD